MLEARGLRKSFGELRAVVGVSLTLEPGRLLGLLGPNGAGKTTTVSMLTGLVTPDAGEVLVDGHRLAGDADSTKRRLGLVPQDLALYEELSARANLRFFGALYGLAGAALERAIAAALELVGLADRARDRVGTLQRRHEAAPQPRGGPPARSRRPAAGRADGRRRSAEPQRDLRQPPGPEGARQGAALHHALHGGGRAAGRPDRDHRPRPGDRRRHAATGSTARTPAPAAWRRCSSP